MESYCIKCKAVTKFKGKANVIKTKNNRYLLTGICSVCAMKKTSFISKKTGEGLLGKLLGLPNGKVPILSDIPIIGKLI